MNAKKLKFVIEKTLKESGYSLEKIVLFGSRARGDYKDDSDWDIMVVVRESLSPDQMEFLWCEIMSALRQAFRHASFDLVIRSRDFYEERKKLTGSLINIIEQEGVIL